MRTSLEEGIKLFGWLAVSIPSGAADADGLPWFGLSHNRAMWRGFETKVKTIYTFQRQARTSAAKHKVRIPIHANASEAPSAVSQPTWRGRTNVWREVTSPARGQRLHTGKTAARRNFSPAMLGGPRCGATLPVYYRPFSQ